MQGPPGSSWLAISWSPAGVHPVRITVFCIEFLVSSDLWSSYKAPSSVIMWRVNWEHATFLLPENNANMNEVFYCLWLRRISRKSGKTTAVWVPSISERCENSLGFTVVCKAEQWPSNRRLSVPAPQALLNRKRQGFSFLHHLFKLEHPWHLGCKILGISLFHRVCLFGYSNGSVLDAY
jgi:hypothetical protein